MIKEIDDVKVKVEVEIPSGIECNHMVENEDNGTHSIHNCRFSGNSCMCLLFNEKREYDNLLPIIFYAKVGKCKSLYCEPY